MRYGKIFGINIAVGERAELLSRCERLLVSGGAISTVNPEILALSQKSEELREALSESLNIPDGVGVTLALSLKGIKSERFPGVELGEALLDLKPVRLAIIGGEGDAPRRAVRNLCKKHPLATPSFTESGYGYSVEKIKRMIEKHSPDVVFVCLGSPKQELLIRELRKSAPRQLFVALGGSVDIYSGSKRRAPAILRRIGCEWLFRFISEPSRIKRAPRILSFCINSTKESVLLNKSAEKSVK